MRDIELTTLMRSSLAALVPARHAGPLGYKMRYQPTQQGRPTEPTLWFHKLGDVRYGQRLVRNFWDGAVMQRIEVQSMATTYQISATQSEQMADVTPSDVVNIVASVMQSEDWILRLRPYHVQVLRTRDVRGGYDKNDQDQWEQTPSFDITFSHTDTYRDDQQVVTAFEFDVLRVPDII